MNNKYIIFISLFLVVVLISPTYCQYKFCDIVDGFVNPGQYSIDRQTDGGFCKNWVFGPVSSAKMILLSFSLINIDCSSGDNLIVYSEDRYTVLYNYCSPIPSQSTLVYVEAKYIFITLSTSSSRLITASIRYYIIDQQTTLSTSAVELSTATPTTTGKFGTLSSASTTLSTVAVSAGSTFGTLSTAGLTSSATSSSTPITTATRFPTLSTAGLTSTQLVETTSTSKLSSCPSTPKVINSATPIGIIQSPNYPNRYPNNANCYWAIEALPDEKIYLEFEIINLPTFLAGVLYANCPSDYISIADFRKQNETYKLCGDRRDFRLSIPYSKALIHFYSNGITEQQIGFRLTYRIVKTGTTIATTSSTSSTPSTTTRTTTITGSTTTTRSTTSTSTRTTTTTTASTTSTRSTTTIATTPNSIACGIPYFTPKDTSLLRIIGGTESTPHSYPWTVLITDDSFICGASLINNNWLVTAAHCVDGLSPASLKVHLGMHNRETKDASTITKTIKSIIINPNYVGELNQWDADIALLKLSEPVTFTNEIKPICLPSQGNNLAVLAKTGMVAGWGRTKGFGSDQVLMQTTITVDGNIKCDAKTTNNMICAGTSGVFASGSCEGDSGGPFMIMQNNVFYLAGIVSWGKTDCSPPSVYTKVSNFIDWINLTVSTR